MSQTVTLEAVAAFGADAERLARRLPPGVEAVITDVANVTAAYVEAVKRHVAGRPFYAMVLTDEPRLKVSNEVAKTILESISDYDNQYAAMQQLGFGVVSINGKPVNEVWDVDHNPWHVIHEFLALGEATLVRSVDEYTRQNRRNGRVPRSFRRFVCEPALPAFKRRRPERPAVVVWVDATDPLYARLPLLALREFRGDVTYVSPQQIPGVSFRRLHPDDPQLGDVLALAGCAVCVDPSDPGAAIAFARHGVPTVAPETSGAHEYVFGSVPWNGSSGTNLLQSVARALGSVVSIAVEPPDVPRLVPERLEPSEGPLPLVTVITMTYNRPELVRKVLGGIAAQTYPNVEHLIVNDAGTPLDDIVAEFPGARLITLTENVGTTRALKIGLDAARGEFISILPDDDWLYPDHIERIMAAILRTGASVAHTTTLLRFVKTRDDGAEVTWGFNNSAFAMTATASQAQLGTPVANHQVLQRREAFGPDDVGFFLLDTIVADQEYHMRLAERYPFVFVDQVTSEFRDHPGNSGKQYNWSKEMEHIYEDVRPLPDRPILQAQRRSNVVTLKSVPVGENVNKPTIWWEKGLPPEAE